MISNFFMTMKNNNKLKQHLFELNKFLSGKV